MKSRSRYLGHPSRWPSLCRTWAISCAQIERGRERRFPASSSWSSGLCSNYWRCKPTVPAITRVSEWGASLGSTLWPERWQGGTHSVFAQAQVRVDSLDFTMNNGGHQVGNKSSVFLRRGNGQDVVAETPVCRCTALRRCLIAKPIERGGLTRVPHPLTEEWVAQFSHPVWHRLPGEQAGERPKHGGQAPSLSIRSIATRARSAISAETVTGKTISRSDLYTFSSVIIFI